MIEDDTTRKLLIGNVIILMDPFASRFWRRPCSSRIDRQCFTIMVNQ